MANTPVCINLCLILNMNYSDVLFLIYMHDGLEFLKKQNYMCACAHATAHIEVIGQPMGVLSPSTMWVPEIKFSLQAQWQVPLPREPA